MLPKWISLNMVHWQSLKRCNFYKNIPAIEMIILFKIKSYHSPSLEFINSKMPWIEVIVVFPENICHNILGSYIICDSPCPSCSIFYLFPINWSILKSKCSRFILPCRIKSAKWISYSNNLYLVWIRAGIHFTLESSIHSIWNHNLCYIWKILETTWMCVCKLTRTESILIKKFSWGGFLATVRKYFCRNIVFWLFSDSF